MATVDVAHSGGYQVQRLARRERCQNQRMDLSGLCVYLADSRWRKKEAEHYLTESVIQKYSSIVDRTGSHSPLDNRTWLVLAFRNMDSVQMQAWI